MKKQSIDNYNHIIIKDSINSNFFAFSSLLLFFLGLLGFELGVHA
jgi:hypothetical protein